MERKEPENPAIIAVDFDGTLATGAWPEINGDTRWNGVLADWLKERIRKGDHVILWTCRENYGGIRFEDREYLNEALKLCTRNHMFFSSVNRNYGEDYGEYLSGTMRYGRKVLADVYIDDHSLPFDPKGRMAKLFWKVYLWMMARKLKKMKRVG